MRRTPLATIAGSLALALAVSACGGDDDDASSTSSAASEASPGDSADATTPDTSGETAPASTDGGSVATDDSVVDMTLVPATTVPVPEVSVPDSIPTELVVTEITSGTGDPAAAGDIVFVNYVGVRSEDGEQFDTNYGGQPFPVTLGAGGVIPGWDEGLVGVTSGERLQLDIPNDLAYGDQAQGDVIQAGDALTFVIDVLAIVPPTDPADAPVATDLPLSSEPVDELVVEDLREGDGATLEEGMSAVLHLIAARGDDGEILESTWEGPPQAFVVTDGALLPGLIEGLPGMQVGGRRAITIPFDPAMAAPDPETDVIIVADLLAVY